MEIALADEGRQVGAKNNGLGMGNHTIGDSDHESAIHLQFTHFLFNT